jgi:hypothetical protein
MNENDHAGKLGAARPGPIGPAATRAAREIRLARETDDLRRERDRLLLDLERGLGRAGMARVLGLDEQSVARLIQRSRTRLHVCPPDRAGSDGEIAASRVRARQATRAAGRSFAADETRPRAAPGRREALGPRIARDPGRREDPGAAADAHYEALGLRNLSAQERAAFGIPDAGGGTTP